jgi:threonyl-tRNA synthetase
MEHFAGAFPLWLSPMQVKIIPVADKFNDYATKIAAQIKENNLRVEIDDSDDSFSKKIRNAELMKIPI